MLDAETEANQPSINSDEEMELLASSGDEQQPVLMTHCTEKTLTLAAR